MAGNLVNATFYPLDKVAKSYERVIGDATGGADKSSTVTCQFNPNELSVSKAAQYAEVAIPGLDSPILQFVRGSNERVSLNLFFDSTEPDAQGRVHPVTLKTNKFYNLVKMSGEHHAPPRLLLTWGATFPGTYDATGPITDKDEKNAPGHRKGFVCVVESVEQNFTYFSPEGAPLRATLAVALREYKTLEMQLAELNLQTSDHTRTYTVEQGDTLPLIAHKTYEDASRWQFIARANGIVDPRRLQVGQVLTLPVLRR
ncbi:LysM peptidoglycan-binding domain-containing protein [Persicimonas caeni]|uniref:LysM peptidoglycan-binding domain-containing protein n=1 Tax=Persicimonas caeni TaxID=2292766 RepID=A0A4Y6PVW6_PERCE|nr:LysM peptidoglycan-binding domain-containing protein [Persicimonas caeni]QDG52259.1 LysM peptidoglycan-binding domain-containing protein [Persicimonas caeni]QED33481.1 LysM peptidoglycan-binding domain-containing protein [Persicimonas caeni]